MPAVTEEDPGVHHVAVEDGSRGHGRGRGPRRGRMNGKSKSSVRMSVFWMFLILNYFLSLLFKGSILKCQF